MERGSRLLGLVHFPVEHKELVMHAAILVCCRSHFQVPEGFVKFSLCTVHLAQQHVCPGQLRVEFEALVERSQRFLGFPYLDQGIAAHQVGLGI